MHIRGYNVFPSKIFGLTVPKNLLGNTSVCQKISSIEKYYASEKGGITFLRRKLLSHSTKKFRCGTLRCLRKSRVLQKFMHTKGTSPNSAEKFLSHSANKNRRRTLLCFEKILVSKTFKKRRGECSRFFRCFLSHRTETKSFREKFWYRKKFMDKRGHITIFSRNFYVSQCQKNSYGNRTASEKLSGFEKFY